MNIITTTQARAQFFRLIDETAQNHQPILITGKRNNAVLISQEDWEAIRETMYLLSIPRMRESIQEGITTPIAECETELDW